LEIVKNRSTIVSLRLLDWFVLHYLSAHEITNESVQEKQKRQEMYFLYTNNLNAYKKVWFDPFARESPDKGSHKILFNTEDMTMSILVEKMDTIEEPHILSTTIGQLNFFKCAIENGFIEYVFCYHEKIQQHMIDNISSKRKEKTSCIYTPSSDESDGYIQKKTKYNLLHSLPQTLAHDPTIHVSIQRKI
jgi:hypothetical protein